MAVKPHLAMWGVIAAMLLAPLVAMRFTDDVAWTGFDFAVAGALLIGAGAAYEVLSRMPALARHRTPVAIALIGVVAIVWAQGAVGIV